MPNRLVMVCLDGKTQAQKALEWYLDTVARPNDHVVLFHCSQWELHVGLPGIAVNVENVSKQVQKAKDKAEKIISDAADILRHRGIKCYSKIESRAKPHEAILHVIDEEKVDYVVMGTRDLGSLKRALVGSVSTEVVRHANVPVTVVKSKEKPEGMDQA